MNQYVIRFLVVGSLLSGILIWGCQQTAPSRTIDSDGGIRLIYRVAQTADSVEAGRTLDEVIESAIQVLSRRSVTGLRPGEISARRKGTDQIVIELPAISDIEMAKMVMGSSGRLIGYHAKNVSTATQRRRYERSETITIEGAPVEMFVRSSGGEPFGPEDPEYAEMIEGWDVVIQGQDLKGATPLVRSNGTVPEFRFSSAGAKKMEAWTRKYSDRGENLAFVIDGVVYSIAPIQTGVILTDEAFIDGAFDSKTVYELCKLLNAGVLDVILSLVSEELIDASKEPA